MPTHDDADKLYKQALEAGRRGDDPQATTLLKQALTFNLANTLDDLGKPAQAEPYYHQALTLYQTLPNTEEKQATCLHNLANTLRELGQLAQAESHYRQALTLYQAIPNTEENQAICLNDLAITLSLLDKLADAESYYRQALTLYQGIP